MPDVGLYHMKVTLRNDLLGSPECKLNLLVNAVDNHVNGSADICQSAALDMNDIKISSVQGAIIPDGEDRIFALYGVYYEFTEKGPFPVSLTPQIFFASFKIAKDQGEGLFGYQYGLIKNCKATAES